MIRSAAPEIGRIPAEIHAEASALGLIAETYTDSYAGHGVTGRVAWAISSLHTSRDGMWTDAPRVRYGTDSSHEHARASLRDALAQIRAERAL